MSNIYPVWWDTTITIYNSYTDPQTNVTTWHRSVVDGAFWKYVGNKLEVGDITIQSNAIICRVRKDERFLEKYQWVELPNDRMSEHFTFGTGDILVKGEVNDVVDEYQKGTRSTDLLKKYKALQGCMQIQQVTVNVGPGRCNEHYYLVGE